MLFLWICSTLVSHVPSKCIGNRIKKGIKEIWGEKKQFLKLIEYRNIAKMSFPFMYKFKVSAELFTSLKASLLQDINIKALLYLVSALNEIF